jgi:hypothetical protein
MRIKKGKYKHYKGDIYEIVEVGRDSGTLEEVVVYKGLYNSDKFGNNPIWVRPLKEFIGEIEIDGKKIKRFEFVG